jgi:poly-gamma-glutamate synthase PgsB/CapB
MSLPLSLLVVILALVALGAIEARLHARRLASIPIRIHVNGTRGKSSVVRLVAGALRAHGLSVYAKATGTLPRLIIEDGSEYPVYRPGRANIIEQRRIVAIAARQRADALVLECMALQPRLQALSEQRLVHSTHGVITNVGPDHLDVMGPDERGVALALLGTCPVGGSLYTGDTRYRQEFEHACADRGATLVAVEPRDLEAVSDAEIERFSYVEHRENVALALKLTGALGVPRDVALRGMWEARPDAGALREFELDFFGRRIVFVNGFAANDPRSTERIWRLVLAHHRWAERRILVINCRFDRPDRSRQIGEALASWPAADRYLLVGSGTYVLARTAVSNGIKSPLLTPLEGASPDIVFEEVLAVCGRGALVMGAGNIGGVGLDLVKYFGNRARVEGPEEMTPGAGVRGAVAG